MKRVIPYKYVTKCKRCDTIFGYEKVKYALQIVEYVLLNGSNRK